jgi:poly(3-hydroxybutyrate) depolymerase
MSKRNSVQSDALMGLSVPFLWPMAAAAQIAERGLDLYARNLKFVAEEQKIRHELRPKLATANRVMLDLRTMVFRDYTAGKATGVPTIVDAPYAGHTAMIADYHNGQSLIETLLSNGVKRVFLTDWKSATEDMKDLDIDQYLAELNVCVDDLGNKSTSSAFAREVGCRRCMRRAIPTRLRHSCWPGRRSIRTQATARSSVWHTSTRLHITKSWSRWAAG